MDVPQFGRSPAEGWAAWLPPVFGKAAGNMFAGFRLGMFLTHLDKNLGVWLLDCVAGLYLPLSEAAGLREPGCTLCAPSRPRRFWPF